MTPITLRFSGIFSYQENVTIDFQKLSLQGIFGIFGAVGSGKSAIIDAITFVLYGDYYRSPNKNIYYNLMNLKSVESRIEFRFGHNDKMYEFQYQAKRSPSNHLNISKNSRKGYEIADDLLIPLETNDAGKILDLDFDEFIKLVIIPQGQFAEFINLTDGNRTKMLKKILKLDKFSLFSPTNRLLNKAKEQLAFIDGQLTSLGEINEGNIQEKKNYIEKNKKEYSHNTQIIIDLGKSIEKDNILRKQTEELIHWENEKSELQEQETYFTQLKSEIRNYQSIQTAFYSLFIRRNHLQNDIDKSQSQSINLNKQLEKINNQYNIAKHEQQTLLSDFKNAEEIQSTIEKLLVYKELKTKKIQKTTIQKELQAKSKALQELTEKRQRQKSLLEKTEDDITRFTQEMFRETFVTQQLNKIKEFKKASQDLYTLQSKINAVNTEISGFSQKKKQHLDEIHKVHNINIERDEKINANISRLQLFLSQFMMDKEGLESQFSQISELYTLQKFAHHLHDHAPCPLCGSEDHPRIFDDKNVQQESEDIRSRIDKINQKIKHTEICIKELQIIIEVFRLKSTELQKLSLESETVSGMLQKLRSEISSLHEETLLNEIDTINQAKTEKIQSETLKNKIQSYIYQIDKEIDLINIKNTENEFIRIESQIDSIESKHHFQTINSLDQQNTDLKITELNARKASLLKVLDQEKELTKQHQTISAQIHVLSEHLTSIQNDWKELEILWQKELKANDLDEEHVLSNLNQKRNITEEQTKIDTFQNKKNNILFKINELKNTIDGKKYNPEIHRESILKKEKLEQANTDISGKIQVYSNEISQIEAGLLAQKKLLNDKETVERRIQNLNTLLSLFRGEKFVQYVSRQYTRHLFQLANKRFKTLTFNQLELSIDEDSNFSIIDYMNDKRPRSIKTLSGGQLFQASLCLALALSEQLQLIQNQNQQFFFIDEGFGTLDKQSLDIVLETLKKLKSEGRTVGIISHVEELRQEIDYNIQVIQDPEKGSFVKLNY